MTMPEITEVERYKGETFKVVFGDGKTFFWNANIVSQFGIRKGLEMPDTAVEQADRDNTFRKARERALYLLDQRDHSFVEMFNKLDKNYPEDICLEVVNSLAELKLIDDRRYGEKLAERLLEVKKLGYYRARQEMLFRGLDRELVEDILAGYEEGTDERLAELIEKKYAHKITDGASLRKVKNALARLGYSFEEINRALEDYETEDDSCF